MRNFAKEQQEGFQPFEEDEITVDDTVAKKSPIAVRQLTEAELNAQFEERRNRRHNRE